MLYDYNILYSILSWENEETTDMLVTVAFC